MTALGFERLKRFGDRWFERRLDEVVGLRFSDYDRALWYGLKRGYPQDAKVLLRQVRTALKSDAHCRSLEPHLYYETGARTALILLDYWDRGVRNLDAAALVSKVAPPPG